jgi:hypothetical protein
VAGLRLQSLEESPASCDVQYAMIAESIFSLVSVLEYPHSIPMPVLYMSRRGFFVCTLQVVCASLACGRDFGDVPVYSNIQRNESRELSPRDNTLLVTEELCVCACVCVCVWVATFIKNPTAHP